MKLTIAAPLANPTWGARWLRSSPSGRRIGVGVGHGHRQSAIQWGRP